MSKLRVFTAFSGYDSQCMALDRLGMNYELVGWSEIDKFAIQAHNAIYPQWSDRNLGDISKIDWNSVPDFDLFTYSFPCTDISSAGQQKGLSEGSGTRSSLLWECRKAIEAKRPKYLLMENVKALTQKKFMPYLQKWMDFLSSLDYTNFAQVLNAKDYGVPQNRERVFMLSILSDAWYDFPQPFRLKKVLADLLEEEVDEKYFLKNFDMELLAEYDKTPKAVTYTRDAKGKVVSRRLTDIANTVHTSTGGGGNTDCFVFETKVIKLGNTNPSGNGINGNVYGTDGISPTLTTNKGEGIKICQPLSCAMRGRNPQNPSDRSKGAPTEQRIEIGSEVANYITTVQKDSLLFQPHILYKGEIVKDGDGLSLQRSDTFGVNPMRCLSPTLRANKHDAGVVVYPRIRKLTPRECLRLMGVSESDIDKMMLVGISNTQLYKMAGNSIVVDVLYYIFKKLFNSEL